MLLLASRCRGDGGGAHWLSIAHTSLSHLTASMLSVEHQTDLRGARGAPDLTLRTSVRCRASHYTGGPPRDCPHYYKTRRLSPLCDVAPRANVTRSLIGPPAASLLWRHAPPLFHPRRPLGGDPPEQLCLLVLLHYWAVSARFRVGLCFF